MRAGITSPSPAERTVSQPDARRRTGQADPRAALLALQRTAGNRAVARWVGQRASQWGWRYYSSWEPGTLYATEAEARAADERLAAAQTDLMEWTPETRFPTVYSYTHTASTSQLSDKPQGPHTFPHVEVGTACNELKGREEWLQVFYEQVPDPAEHEQMLRTEKPNWGPLEFELTRLTYEYRNLYDYAEGLLWDPKSDVGNLRALVSRLLELHPYGTYGWKSKKAASHRSTKGKGERKGKAKVDPGGQWQDKARYQRFLADRKRLCSGDYMITDEELEYDGQLDGEYVSMDELLGAVVAGDEVVGNTIQLYPTGEWVIRAITLHTSKTEGGVIVTGARIRLGRKGG